jgi:hypothetical protein
VCSCRCSCTQGRHNSTRATTALRHVTHHMQFLVTSPAPLPGTITARTMAPEICHNASDLHIRRQYKHRRRVVRLIGA